MLKKTEHKSKILFIELWGIGDIVLASGALRALRESFSYSEITLLARHHAEVVLLNNKCVNKFIVFDFPWTKFKAKYNLWRWNWFGLIRLIKRLRAERFDLVLDARGDIRNNLLAFLIGAKRRVGYNWTGGGFFLTDVVKAGRSRLHRVDAWAILLKHLGLKNVDTKPTVNLSREEVEWAEVFFKNSGIEKNNLLIGIHPGAGIKTRCWPLERFVSVASHLRGEDIQVVFFVEPGGYGENAVLPGGCLKVRVDLRKYMAIAKNLDFLICNDGGAMHMATAVGVPVVAIFGPMKKEWFGPCGDNNVVIIREDVPCRPCFDYCRYKQSYCLTGISEEKVIEQVDKVINRIEKGK